MNAGRLAEAAAALRGLGLEPQPGVRLAEHTTLHVGGPADLFVEVADEAQLLAAAALAQRSALPWFVLGGGSNLLIRDGGMDGLVLKVRTRGFDLRGERLTVAGGEPLAEVVERLARASVGGLEFAAGIPGTVGGAVCGNAGAYGEAVGDRLVSARVLRDGAVVDVPRADFRFDYRQSVLKVETAANGGCAAIVLQATFAVDPAPTAPPLAKVQEILAHRDGRLPPWSLGSAGSWFKNLPAAEPGGRRTAAGLLLDQVGAKDLRVGDARVFEKHANIVVNAGHATARQVLELTETMRRLVRERFGVELEPEVMYLGRDEGPAA